MLRNDKKGKRSEKATTGRTGKLSTNAAQAVRAFVSAIAVQDSDSDGNEEEEEVCDEYEYDNTNSNNKSNNDISEIDEVSDSS